MKVQYLLDTNIISEPLKVVPDYKVIEYLRLNEGKVAICSPVLHELRYGMERLPLSRKKTNILQYINTVILPTLPVLSYSVEAAIIHAEFRVILEVKGLKTGFVDSQIAAIALENNLILVTRNIKDFMNIEKIRVENWFS